jgi:Zonular occludens toxin (Zot)
MISFIYGGYGDGKSYSGMRCTRSELLNGRRGISTNLAIKEKEFAGYLQKKFPKSNCVLHQRLRILEDEEIGTFMLHRISTAALWYDIPAPCAEDEKRGKRPEWHQLRDKGMLFIIEEAHEFFNAYSWQEIGRAFRAYKNQNRKFSDDIIFITPQLAEIDKQLRTSGQSYTRLINLGKRKLHGISMPATFLAREYANFPGPQSHPVNQYIFSMEKDLADCYDTAKGVRGVQGFLADKENKVKGVPWWLVLGVVIVLAVLFLSAPFLLRSKIQKSLLPPAKRIVQNTNENRGALDLFLPTQKPGQVGQSTRQKGDEEVFCTGFMVYPNNTVEVTLSDGRVARSQDGEVQTVAKRAVKVFDQIYQVRKREPEYTPQPVQQFSGMPAEGSFDERPGIQVIPFPNRPVDGSLLTKQRETISSRMFPGTASQR